MTRPFVRTGATALSCFALLATSLAAIPALAATSVGDEAGLRAAIAANEDTITLTGNITLTSPIVVPGTFSGTINGAGNTITANMGDPDDPETDKHKGMFITNGDVTLDNLIVDGGQKWRTFWVATGSLKLQNNSTLTNGRANKYLGDGGAVMLWNNTKLVVNDSKITASEGFVAQTPEGGPGNGGAISSQPNATIEGTNCTFENNKTSSSEFSNGGAIFLSNDGRMTLNNCTFTGNSAVNISSSGSQGGAIYTSPGSVTTINGSTFNIAHGFNTGGAIRSHEGVLNVQNSTFTIGELGDGYGISGGAIAVEATKTLIEGSTFTSTTNGVKVTHAGGFITVVGRQPDGVADGEYGFTVRNSTFTGNGSWWNGPSTATYGGGITFEGGPTVSTTYTALIEGSTFRNMAADENGGAISLGTKKGEAGGGTTLTLRNSTIDNTRTRFAWKDTVGGGIYVGPGHTLLVDGGTRINNTFAVRGGAIFNMGTTTLTGGSDISHNTTYQIGGGVYNDGVLTVDEATLTNNRNAEGRKYPGKADPVELVGGNIYAHKDVTITPNATLDANDVRVLDGRSAIVLTGELTKQINVSISEKPQATLSAEYDEAESRYLGYTVAKGNGTYDPNANDAKQLHYVTYNGAQPVAEFADHDSIGKWDYVWNPTAKTVVLGQRAKMVYHSNQGTFDPAQCNSTTFESPKNETKEQIYWVYSSTPDAYTIDPDNKAVTKLLPLGSKVCREDVSFRDWYEVNGPHAGDKNTVTNETRFNFDQFFGAANNKPGGKIVDILNKNQFDAYAGWELAKFPVTYEYVSKHDGIEDAPELPAQLKKKATDLNLTGDKARRLGSDLVARGPFSNDDSPLIENIEGKQWVFDAWYREKDGNRTLVEDTAISKIQEAHHFVGVWKLQVRKTHSFESATPGKELPQSVLDLTPGAGNWEDFATELTPTEPQKTEVKVSDGKWTFQSWNVRSANGKSNFNFVGKWVFEELPKVPVTFVVENCLWNDGTKDNKVEEVTVTRVGDTDNVTGKLGNVFPTDMKPADGYEGGAWDTVPTAETDITGPVTFTYSCTRTMLTATHNFVSGTAGKELPEEIVAGTPIDFTFPWGEEKIVPGEFGNDLPKTVLVTDGTWTFESWDKDSVLTPHKDQLFIGTWVFTPIDPVNVTFKLDSCQWQDGSTADKTVAIERRRDGSTIAGVLGNAIPSGMTPLAGFRDGKWDVALSATTVVSEDTTFTYTCDKLPAPQVINKPAPKGGKLAVTGATAETAGLMALALAGLGLMMARRRND